MSHALDMITLAAAQARDELAAIDAKCVEAAAHHANLTRQREDLVTLLADLEQAEVTLALVEDTSDPDEPRCRVCGCTTWTACSPPCAWRPDDGRGPCCTACDPDAAAVPAYIVEVVR